MTGDSGRFIWPPSSSSAYPALKRVGKTTQIRRADDTDWPGLVGKENTMSWFRRLMAALKRRPMQLRRADDTELVRNGPLDIAQTWDSAGILFNANAINVSTTKMVSTRPDQECEYITWHDRANYHRRCRTRRSDGSWSEWIEESCGVCTKGRVAPYISEEEAASIEAALKAG